LDVIFTARCLLFAVVLALLLACLPLLPFPTEVKHVIALIGVYQMLRIAVNGFSAVFIAHERMRVAALLDASLFISVAMSSIAVTLLGGDFIRVMSTFPTFAFLHFLLGYVLVARSFGAPRFSLSPSRLVRVYREALPYNLSALAYRLNLRTDIVLLGLFAGTAATGLYNVAFRLLYVPLYVPHFVAVAMLPSASRMFPREIGELRSLYHSSLNWMILCALPAALGLWLIAPEIIRLVFGPDFAESVGILRTLAALVVVSSLNLVMGAFLVACDQQVLRVKSQGISTGVNIVANLALIPLFGGVGAATAALLSESVLGALYLIGLRQALGRPKVGARLAIATIGSASFFFPLILLRPSSLPVVIAAAASIYVLVLLLFPGIRRNELESLLGLLKR
jgi:O-antigen/teichoic acid export membrane protein